MKVMVDVSIVPLGVGLSLSKYVAECEKVFSTFDIKTHLHPYGTILEGEWDEVFAAIKKCHEVLHEIGVPRITASLRVGTRTDKSQTMEDKLASVKDKLNSA
ncbi:MAG: thiamine-binding protein [Gemmatimonadetes bacterium]|nr:MAG: thiamine-binding protein [Gemmatimonadota bacterium]